VKVLHIDNEEDWSESDVLIMGTDGLWDVTSNDKVAEIVTKSFRQFPPDENRIRYRCVFYIAVLGHSQIVPLVK
jgi:serine/threonine protein phosphatase PrpC